MVKLLFSVILLIYQNLSKLSFFVIFLQNVYDIACFSVLATL